MENLIVERTTSLPGVLFRSDGNFLIEGRSLPDNAAKTYEPLFSWIESFSGEKIKFSINLEYLNTSSSLQLFRFLKLLDSNCEIKEIDVIWHYDEDDEDHLETGQIFAEQLPRVKFTFLAESLV